MPLVGMGRETYFFVNGLKTLCPIQLYEGVSLLSAHYSASTEDIIKSTRMELSLPCLCKWIHK